MVELNKNLESSESQSLQAELQSLYREIIQQLEDFSAQDVEHADVLQEALHYLQQLNIEAAKQSLDAIELPEIVDQQLDALAQMQESLGSQDANEYMAPAVESSQDERDEFVAIQAKLQQKTIADQQVSSLKEDMANADNYPKDMLSRGVYLLLQQISKRLRNTDI